MLPDKVDSSSGSESEEATRFPNGMLILNLCPVSLAQVKTFPSTFRTHPSSKFPCKQPLPDLH